jgi:CRP-like cAMP-binding protein
MTRIPQEVSGPDRNLIVRSLPDGATSGFRELLTPVTLRLGDVLYDVHEEQKHVFFPTEGVVSMLYLMENGSSAEIALVGRDGMVGMASVLGSGQSANRAMVQVAGFAYRASAKTVHKLMATESARAVLLRYSQIIMTQMSQTAVCNRHHTVVQQLCRWILQSLDLVDGNEIQMTQQLMAEMLGVRREGVSVLASGLRADGLIDYTRGTVRVLDRGEMEARVCECYTVVVRETRRLLPQPKRRARAEA